MSVTTRRVCRLRSGVVGRRRRNNIARQGGRQCKRSAQWHLREVIGFLERGRRRIDFRCRDIISPDYKTSRSAHLVA